MPRLRVLTVCSGNICRSPAAAVVLTEAARRAGLGELVEISSAGTAWEAEGAEIDERTVDALVDAGYAPPFEHSARAVHHDELLSFDLVLPMTAQHAERLRRMVDGAPEGEAPAIILWRQFDPKAGVNAREEELCVEDPWFSGNKAFRRMVAMFESCTPALILHLRGMLAQKALLER